MNLGQSYCGNGDAGELLILINDRNIVSWRLTNRIVITGTSADAIEPGHHITISGIVSRHSKR